MTDEKEKKVSPKRWFDKGYDVSENIPLYDDDYDSRSRNWGPKKVEVKSRWGPRRLYKKKPQGAD